MAAHQASPSLGFSRQEHCSILGGSIWRRDPQFILISLHWDKLKKICVRLSVNRPGHIADSQHFTLYPLVLIIILSLCFCLYTIHGNTVTRVQSWPEKGEKGKHSSWCLHHFKSWQDLKWVEGKAHFCLPCRNREASLWGKRSFHKHQVTEAIFK